MYVIIVNSANVVLPAHILLAAKLDRLTFSRKSKDPAGTLLRTKVQSKQTECTVFVKYEVGEVKYNASESNKLWNSGQLKERNARSERFSYKKSNSEVHRMHKKPHSSQPGIHY